MAEIPVSEPASILDIPNIPKPLETTVRIGNEFAHIRTTPEALKSNLITEAVKQGISEAVATSYAEKARFSVGSSRDFLAQLASKEPLLFESLSQRVTSILQPKRSIIGMVLEKDGISYCNVAIEPIVNIASRKYAQYRQEVQEAAVAQEVDEIWRHERQHIIQNMNPVESDVKKRVHKVHKAIKITSLGVNAIIAECIALNPDLFLTHKELAIILALSTGAMVAGTIYRNKFSPPEQEANRMQDPKYYTGNSPFQVAFEK